MELSCDLVAEILSRVPATSLARLRYTCKQWETLVADPRFVKKHMSHMRCREQQFIVFNDVPKSSSGPSVSRVSMDLDKTSLDLHVLQPTSTRRKLVVVDMFHCDGLMVYVLRNSRLLVTNPLLKQERLIKCDQGFSHSVDVCGLGYISNQSSPFYDYKIVKFGCTPSRGRVEVYEFKSDTWKVVVDESFDGFFGLPKSGVCLRGSPYWIGCVLSPDKTYSIQSFDFSKDRFEPLSLPPSSVKRFEIVSLGTYRGDYLSLLHKSHPTGEIHIWVMKQFWSRLMTVAVSPIHNFMKTLRHSTYFIINNGKLVLSVRYFEMECVGIYVLGENQECRELGCNSNMDFPNSCCYYDPSLLQVPGFST